MSRLMGFSDRCHRYEREAQFRAVKSNVMGCGVDVDVPWSVFAVVVAKIWPKQS